MPKGKRTTTTKRKRATAKAKAQGLPPCEVQGCGLPGLEQHDGPNGKVTLCGRCGELARSSLKDAERRQEILDIAAAPMEKVLARERAKQQGRVKAVLLG